MRESLIEKKVNTYAESKGFIQYKLVKFIGKGFPDRTYIYKGSVIFIEFKTLIGKLSIHQEYEIVKLSNSGARVYVINSVEQGKDIINEIINEKK